MNLTHETLELHTRQPFGIARWTHSVYPRTFRTPGTGTDCTRGWAQCFLTITRVPSAPWRW